ncbi:hypothetical protein MT418_8510 [Batrachochytrium dendrobatidis]
MIQKNGPHLSNVLSSFGVSIAGLDGLQLPTIERKAGDGTIISDRPTGVFFRPSSQFRPDILAFLSKQVCVSFGIKLYTSKIPSAVSADNLESTNPDFSLLKQIGQRITKRI